MRPLIVGGVGGSGTRLAAEVVAAPGIHIGSPHVGNALDNLAWPGSREILTDDSISDKQKLSELTPRVRPFAAHMRRGAREAEKAGPFWGTKIPGSFFYLPYLSRIWRGLRYIHILRHGLDMAFSYNRNQLHNWGPWLGVRPEGDATPGDQLKYWARANAYALEQCASWLPRRHLVVRFEDLCANPRETVDRIAAFAERPEGTADADRLVAAIQPPDSIGRYERLGRPAMFDPADVETVRALGYEVTWSASLAEAGSPLNA